MDKPKNPFRVKTMLWALMEEDWSDLTVAQIAEVFDTTYLSVNSALVRIKNETGYVVPHTSGKTGEIIK